MFNFPQSDCFLPLKIPWELVWIKGYSATFLLCCIFKADLCVSLGNHQGHRAAHQGGKMFEHEYSAPWCSVLDFSWICIGNEADSSETLDFPFLHAPFPHTCLCTAEGCWRSLRRTSDIIKIIAFFPCFPFYFHAEREKLCVKYFSHVSASRISLSFSIQTSGQFVKSLSLLSSFPRVTTHHTFGIINHFEFCLQEKTKLTKRQS